MAGKIELFVLAVLTCTLLLGGCIPSDTDEKAAASRVDETKATLAEQKKAKLLKQIDRKFENPDAHFQLGQLYQADGLWAEAEYHYNIALSFDPVHWSTQAAMVKVLQDSGNKSKATAAAEIYMNQAAGSTDRSVQLGQAFENEKLDGYALACYQQALHLKPNSAEILKRLGYYYLSRDDEARAKGYFIRSFRAKGLQPDVAFELGRMGVKIEVWKKPEKTTKKPDITAKQSEKKPK